MFEKFKAFTDILKLPYGSERGVDWYTGSVAGTKLDTWIKLEPATVLECDRKLKITPTLQYRCSVCAEGTPCNCRDVGTMRLLDKVMEVDENKVETLAHVVQVEALRVYDGSTVFWFGSSRTDPKEDVAARRTKSLHKLIEKLKQQPLYVEPAEEALKRRGSMPLRFTCHWELMQQFAAKLSELPNCEPARSPQALIAMYRIMRFYPLHMDDPEHVNRVQAAVDWLENVCLHFKR